MENHRINAQILSAEKNMALAEKEYIYYLSKKDSIKQLQIKAIEQSIREESFIGDLIETIANQKSDLKKHKESHFFQNIISWLSAALILILSLLTFSLHKNNKLRAKSNELLQDKNVELFSAKERAESAAKAKALFLSTITHELRTPLFTVVGLTHLLLEEDPKPEQLDHLNDLKSSGEYLLLLINNILNLNKLEANNKLEIAKTPFHLEKSVNGIIKSLKNLAEAKKNSIHFEFDKTLPAYIIGDALMLSQILMNLISNAIKFTENGNIWVRVTKVERRLNSRSLITYCFFKFKEICSIKDDLEKVEKMVFDIVL